MAAGPPVPLREAEAGPEAGSARPAHWSRLIPGMQSRLWGDRAFQDQAKRDAGSCSNYLNKTRKRADEGMSGHSHSCHTQKFHDTQQPMPLSCAISTSTAKHSSHSHHTNIWQGSDPSQGTITDGSKVKSTALDTHPKHISHTSLSRRAQHHRQWSHYHPLSPTRLQETETMSTP